MGPGNEPGTILQSVHYPPESIFEEIFSKIDQQPESTTGQAQIGQKLFGVNGLQPLDRFQLDYYFSLDHQVGSETFIEGHPLIPDRERHLALDQ